MSCYVQMDAAVLGDRLPEVTEKPFFAAALCSAGIEKTRKCFQGEPFCEMLSQYPQSAFQGFSGGCRGWVSSSLRPKALCVHLLGINVMWGR